MDVTEALLYLEARVADTQKCFSNEDVSSHHEVTCITVSDVVYFHKFNDDSIFMQNSSTELYLTYVMRKPMMESFSALRI